MRKNYLFCDVGTLTLLVGLALVVFSSGTAIAQNNLPNDQEIVEKAPTYSLEKLVELIGVYDRLGKRQVTQALFSQELGVL